MFLTIIITCYVIPIIINWYTIKEQNHSVEFEDFLYVTIPILNFVVMIAFINSLIKESKYKKYFQKFTNFFFLKN